MDDEPPDADPDGPNLTALEGGGRSPGGQSPLLLPVPSAKAAVADYRQLAEDLAALYGVRVAVRQAAAIALDVLGNQRPADPTAYVIERVRANPDPYRPALPTTSSRRRRASGDT